MSTDGWTPPGSDGGVTGPPRPLPVPPPPGAGAWQPPSSPPRRRRRWVLVVVLALVACAAVGVVAVTSIDDEDDDAGRPAAVDPADVPPLVPFADPAGEFGISAPDSWVAVSTRGDLAGVGDREFPDDAARARTLDQVLSGMPRLIVFAAFRAEELGDPFVTNVNIVTLPTPDGADDLDDVEANAPAEVEASTGAEQQGDPTRVTLAAGEAVRVEYAMAGGIEVVQYYVLDGATVWAINMNTADLDEDRALFDAVAATFSLGEGQVEATDRVVAPDNSFAIDVRAPWSAAFPGPDRSAVGGELFPDDPSTASTVGASVAATTTELTRLVVVDREDLDDMVVDTLVFDGITDLDPSLLGLDAIVERIKPPSPEDGVIGAEGRLQGSVGEIAWFQQSFGSFSQLVYVIVSGNSFWQVTFWGDDVMARQQEVDAIVQSFSPL